jgi:hypothetical protein
MTGIGNSPYGEEQVESTTVLHAPFEPAALAAHRVDNACELGEKPVAGRFDQPAAMRGECGLDRLARQSFDGRERPFLVGSRQRE